MIVQVMRRLMGRDTESRLEIDTFSVVTAISKSPSAQNWHTDLDPIHRAEDFANGDQVHLPPFGFGEPGVKVKPQPPFPASVHLRFDRDRLVVSCM